MILDYLLPVTLPIAIGWFSMGLLTAVVYCIHLDVFKDQQVTRGDLFTITLLTICGGASLAVVIIAFVAMGIVFGIEQLASKDVVFSWKDKS